MKFESDFTSSWAPGIRNSNRVSGGTGREGGLWCLCVHRSGGWPLVPGRIRAGRFARELFEARVRGRGLVSRLRSWSECRHFPAHRQVNTVAIMMGIIAIVVVVPVSPIHLRVAAAGTRRPEFCAPSYIIESSGVWCWSAPCAWTAWHHFGAVQYGSIPIGQGTLVSRSQ